MATMNADELRQVQYALRTYGGPAGQRLATELQPVGQQPQEQQGEQKQGEQQQGEQQQGEQRQGEQQQ